VTADDSTDDGETSSIRVFAGECTTEFAGGRERTRRGRVVVLIKPDRTVLVHDAAGYQPVAWLTRADSLSVETVPLASGETPPAGETAGGERGDHRDADSDGIGTVETTPTAGNQDTAPTPPAGGFGLVARRGDETLRIVSHGPAAHHQFPATAAGVPVGACPDCGGTLVRDGGLNCLGCAGEYSLPAGATVLEEQCSDCGLPTVRVERGAVVECCVDPACEPLSDRVAERVDRTYDCPDCGSDLRVSRTRGRIRLECDGTPDCQRTFTVPTGRFIDDCGCGLPVVETATGRTCLDTNCDEAS
jgi:DNA topoisomerase-1